MVNNSSNHHYVDFSTLQRPSHAARGQLKRTNPVRDLSDRVVSAKAMSILSQRILSKPTYDSVPQPTYDSVPLKESHISIVPDIDKLLAQQKATKVAQNILQHQKVTIIPLRDDEL